MRKYPVDSASPHWVRVGQQRPCLRDANALFRFIYPGLRHFLHTPVDHSEPPQCVQLGVPLRRETEVRYWWIGETGGRALLRLRTNTPPVRCMVCTASGFTFLPSCKRARVCVSTPLLSLKLEALRRLGCGGIQANMSARAGSCIGEGAVIAQSNLCRPHTLRCGVRVSPALPNAASLFIPPTPHTAPPRLPRPQR